MRLIHGDCLEHMTKVKAIIADPPDNIGYAYNSYDDNLKPEHYYLWLEKIIMKSMLNCEIFWMSFNAKHTTKVNSIVDYIQKHYHPMWEARTLIWYFTFGQYTSTDFANNYRPILRLMKPGCKTYTDDIRVESERMKLGDPRAAGLRVPGDVFLEPRIVGNSHERRDFHPTQHPVAIYKRIIKFSCSQDDWFMDLFAGSGTCFAAGHENTIGIEIDLDYCMHLVNHFPGVNYNGRSSR